MLFRLKEERNSGIYSNMVDPRGTMLSEISQRRQMLQSINSVWNLKNKEIQLIGTEDRNWGLGEMRSGR